MPNSATRSRSGPARLRQPCPDSVPRRCKAVTIGLEQLAGSDRRRVRGVAFALLHDQYQCILERSRIAEQCDDPAARGLGQSAQRALDEVARVLFPEEAVVARGEELAAIGHLNQQQAIRAYQALERRQRNNRLGRVLDEIATADDIKVSELGRRCCEMRLVQVGLPAFQVGVSSDGRGRVEREFLRGEAARGKP